MLACRFEDTMKIIFSVFLEIDDYVWLINEYALFLFDVNQSIFFLTGYSVATYNREKHFKHIKILC